MTADPLAPAWAFLDYVAREPETIRPLATDFDGLGAVRSDLASMERVDISLRNSAEGARQRNAATQQAQAAEATPALPTTNAPSDLGAATAETFDVPEPLMAARMESRTAAQASGLVVTDADPDPVLEGRQYAAAPLALVPVVVGGLRLAPQVPRAFGALLGTGAGVVLNEAATPPAQDGTPKPPAVDGTTATPRPITVSPDRRKRILDGDADGGGHRHGTGRSGKTKSPSSWSDDEVIIVLEEIASDPQAKREERSDGRTIVEGARDGVEIRVIIAKDKRSVITAHPTNLPRNPPVATRQDTK